jgi:hypothetical protein
METIKAQDSEHIMISPCSNIDTGQLPCADGTCVGSCQALAKEAGAIFIYVQAPPLRASPVATKNILRAAFGLAANMQPCVFYIGAKHCHSGTCVHTKHFTLTTRNALQ